MTSGIIDYRFTGKGEMMKVLVVVGLSEISSHVVEKAVSFSKALSAEVWLLHVAEPEPEFVGNKVDTTVMRDVKAEAFHKEHRRLQEYARAFEAESLKVSALLIQGETVRTILHEAEKLAADLIMMGSHHKGVIQRLLLGSTSEGVLHDSEIPVMVIPTVSA